MDKLEATAKELKEDYSNVEVKVRIIICISMYNIFMVQ
jgi:hypothetical protein